MRSRTRSRSRSSAGPRDGVPDNPGAWITRVARNSAIDRLRRERTLEHKRAILARLERARRRPRSGPQAGEPRRYPDDRLRLIFTCCHPALAPEARVALTLRTLGGLTTAEIARAFLSPRRDGAAAGPRQAQDPRRAASPTRCRSATSCRERLPSVLATLYLIFNEGYLGDRRRTR